MKYVVFVMLILALSCNSNKTRYGKAKTKYKAGLDFLYLKEDERVVLEDSDGKNWPVDITDFQIEGSNFYILDTFHSQQAFIYDKDGKLLSLVGQPGQGPGEYRYPGGFCRSGDRLHLISADRKYILYALDGSYVKENLDVNPGGMSNWIFPAPHGSAIYVMYSRDIPNATLRQLDSEANLIMAFSPPDEEFNLFWDMVNPMGTLVVSDDKIMQVFSHRYQVKIFDYMGTKVDTIQLSSNIYKQPDYEEAHRLDKNKKQWQKFLKKYSLVNGLYKWGPGYLTVLAYTELGSKQEVIEFWDEHFFGLGKYKIPENEKLVGTDADRLVFYDGDARTLIFRRLAEE